MKLSAEEFGRRVAYILHLFGTWWLYGFTFLAGMAFRAAADFSADAPVGNKAWEFFVVYILGIIVCVFVKHIGRKVFIENNK